MTRYTQDQYAKMKDSPVKSISVCDDEKQFCHCCHEYMGLAIVVEISEYVLSISRQGCCVSFCLSCIDQFKKDLENL